MAKRKSKPKEAIPETPTCNCLLLCDDVVVSHGRDKQSLHGVIGVIGLRTLPAITGGFVAYIRLSNVYTNQKVTVGLEDAETDSPLWEFQAELVNRNDPLAVYTLVTRIPPFRVEKAGKYVLKAKHAGVPIAQTPIQIVAASSSGE